MNQRTEIVRRYRMMKPVQKWVMWSRKMMTLDLFLLTMVRNRLMRMIVVFQRMMKDC